MWSPHRDSGRRLISGCGAKIRGLGVGGRDAVGGTGGLRAANLLCVAPQWWTQVVLHVSTAPEGPATGVPPDVCWGLWVNTGPSAGVKVPLGGGADLGGGAAKYLPSLGRDPSAAPPYKVSLLGAYRWLPRSFRSVLWSRSEAVNWGSPPRGPGPAEPPSHVPEGSVTQFPPLRVGRGAGVQGACQTLLVSEKESAPSPVCVCESVCECLCVCENVCDSVNV